MADIACRICHHAESDHTRAHAVKKYGFDTRQACTQCACVEWVAPKEVESVDDAAVDLIDDLDDARRTMSSVEFDDDLYARTRDFIAVLPMSVREGEVWLRPDGKSVVVNHVISEMVMWFERMTRTPERTVYTGNGWYAQDSQLQRRSKPVKDFLEQYTRTDITPLSCTV